MFAATRMPTSHAKAMFHSVRTAPVHPPARIATSSLDEVQRIRLWGRPKNEAHLMATIGYGYGSEWHLL